MQSLVPEPLRSVKSGDEYMQASLVGDSCWGQLFEGWVSCLGCAYPSCLGFRLLGRLCCQHSQISTHLGSFKSVHSSTAHTAQRTAQRMELVGCILECHWCPAFHMNAAPARV